MDIFETYISANNLDCNIVKYDKGHLCNSGCQAKLSIYKNPYCIVNSHVDGQYVLMECNGVITKLSLSSLDAVKSTGTAWFVCKNEYIASNTKGTQLYLHQFITDHHGHGRGQLSVDHINRDKLDNRFENLRVTTQSVQSANCGKRERKYSAQALPPELQKTSLPKYVYYACETLHAGEPNEYVREFFRIEKHPNLKKKAWSSSKSVKKSILDKLVETKQYLSLLDNPEQMALAEELDRQTFKLPPHVRLMQTASSKTQLVYDRRLDSKRYSMRETVPLFDKSQLESYVTSFLEKLGQKYPELVVS